MIRLTLKDWLNKLKDSFNGSVGVNLSLLFTELDRLAAKLGIGPNDPLTEQYLKEAKALYAAFLQPYMANVVEYGWAEVRQLLSTGRVPKRSKRVGASTA